MNIKYTDEKWINRQVKMIENKFKKAGKSYSTGIRHELLDGAIIEHREYGVIVLNLDKFNVNKNNILQRI